MISVSEGKNLMIHELTHYWQPFGVEPKIMPEIEKVIFQKEHTIILWSDNTRTVVRCYEEDYDKEKGLAMAISKKFIERNKFKKLIENATIQDK